MIRRLILQTTIWIAAMGVLLFVPAGTLAWPAAWIYLAEMGVTGIAAGLWLARHDPALLAERMSMLIQRDQKPWDKALVAALILVWCGWHILVALDAVRYGWSEVPLWLQFLGALGVPACMYVAFLAMRANRFAAPVIKVQKDRGHRVATGGPYRVVRHPMYAGALLLFVGMPLLLGSWYGLLLVPIMVLALGARTVMEERMLTRELEGYKEYAGRVRHRLVPLVW